MAEDKSSQDTDEPAVAAAQPGQVIAPGAAAVKSVAEVVPEAVAEPTPASADNLFNPNDEDQLAPPPQPAEQPSGQQPNSVSWTAAEFIAHEKNGGWYLGLAVASISVAGLIFLLTHDAVAAGVIIFGAVVLGIYGARKPRELPYALDHQALQIGQKLYNLTEFRSFAVVPENTASSIVFMPLRRFAPPITIYYAAKDEDAIVNILSATLPYEEHKPDALDRFMQRIRF